MSLNKRECYFTAATFPKPTDVNEVVAKKSAVKYFDFVSGPLNVSLATIEDEFRYEMIIINTYDKAFYIYQQDDQAKSI
jgi:hypothetical protein